MPPIKSDNPSYRKQTPKEGSESPPLEEASFLSPSTSKDFLLWRLKFYAKYGAVARAYKVFDEMRKAKVGSSNTNLFSAEELGEFNSILLLARRRGIKYCLSDFKKEAKAGNVPVALKKFREIERYQSGAQIENDPVGQQKIELKPAMQKEIVKAWNRCCDEAMPKYRKLILEAVENNNIDEVDSFKQAIEICHTYANRKLSEDDAQLLKDSYQNVRKRCIDNYLKISEKQVKDRDPRNLSSYLEEIKRLAEECGPEIADTLKERIGRVDRYRDTLFKSKAF